MRIFVDADACPNPIKDIIIRAAERLKIKTLFIANQPVKLPNSKYISMTLVENGFDIADDKIADEILEGELVITEDIPLADRIITNKGFVISTHGELFTAENIKQRLATRNFLSELRNAGIESGGPSPFSQKDIRNFANQLDRFLSKNYRN